jgi:predicted GNAT family acetyltransferase
MTQAPEVTDNRDQSRFEISIDGFEAELTYRIRAGRLVLVHTGVPDELGGRGVGGLLMQAALAKASAEGLTVVPLCPYARSWLERHRDAAAGIAIAWTDPG